jgi:NAD(P)-dependent dehydrogenase (short-subunit alcohol dehydrogenase family)
VGALAPSAATERHGGRHPQTAAGGRAEQKYDGVVERLAGRRAIVTGAAHGIGLGIATVLRGVGVTVIGVDRDGDALAAAERKEVLIAVRADIAVGDTEALGAEICARHGPVDLLVNNVGIDTPHGFADLDRADYDRVFAANLRGPWFLTRAVTTHMRAGGRPGAVVFVSSLHDHFIRTRPHYSASKAAVAMLVKELAQELGPAGIRVNAVSPGVVLSATVTRTGSPDEEERDRKLVPLGRMGRPDDVGRVVAMLLDDGWCGYVTGANVPVDGGLGLHSWSVDSP